MAGEAAGIELRHCPPGDPCERTIEIRPDGTVWLSALCGEILPVALALVADPAALAREIALAEARR